MSNQEDPSRWSHSTGELEEKRRAEAGPNDTARSSDSYSGAEEVGIALVSARAIDLALLLSSSDEAKQVTFSKQHNRELS